MKKRKNYIFIVLIIALLLLILVSCCVGKYNISIKESFMVIVNYFKSVFSNKKNIGDMNNNMILNVRMPRIIAAVLVGGALSVSGSVYQGVFKNPLVSPDFLGVSQGACIGAACGILTLKTSGWIQILAFAGGIIAVVLTLLIPKLLKSEANIMLVLSGIVVGGFMSSVLGFIKYVADPETQLAAITYWQMGSLSYVSWKQILEITPVIIVSFVLIELMAWKIDVLSLGDNEAKVLGVNVQKWRSIFIILATLLTAGAVCVAGTIGWIGLVIPHIGRFLVGNNNRRLIVASFILGSIFLLLIDTLTRTIGEYEMPISILTGIIGAPFYAWILYKQRRKM